MKLKFSMVSLQELERIEKLYYNTEINCTKEQGDGPPIFEIKSVILDRAGPTKLFEPPHYDEITAKLFFHVSIAIDDVELPVAGYKVKPLNKVDGPERLARLLSELNGCLERCRKQG